MVDGVVEGVLLDPGQRAHPVVDASGRWVFDEGDRLKKPLKPGLGLNTLTSEMWFWSEEWGEMRHKDQVAKSGTYTNPITGKEFQGAPLGRGQVNIKRNTGMDIFSYVQPGPVDEPYRVITSYSDGRPDEIHWASGRTAQIVGDFDLTRPARDNVVVIPPSRGTPGQKTSTVSTRDDLQYPGAHPTVSAEGEWVSDDRDPEAGGLDRVAVSAPGGVREPWEYRPPSSGSESYFGAPGDLWSGMVDWWFSHDIPTEGLPSGGGLMVGPLEMAKLGNFLKDALLPLMAGDIGLAGVGGLGPFDPVPVPFGKVIGEGVKGAKAGVRAVRGAVRGADEAAEGGVAAARALDTEDVPIEFFDDMQGNPGVMAGEVTNQAKVDKLAASIAEDGITEPLILEFHPGTGLVWLGEGNHRLAAARQLGLDSVPVRGVRYEPTPSEVRLSGDGKRLSPYTLEHLNNDDWFGEAWVSESGERLQATFTPSQVGVPTAGGVARETGEATARTVVGETAPTLDAFTEMAGRGKLHPATGRDLPGEATATNPFEFGVINGYSEDDIAHFYLALRAPWNKARTARNVGAVRDDMRELAYEQFLEDRAEYLAKQSGAPLGSVHRQLSDEIGKADVVRGESGEMMLEVDDVEAFDAALKAWEEANPVTPFTEAMERLDPPAGGVARETGEAAVKDAVPEGKILADQRGHAVSEDLHGQPGSVGYADVVGESQYVDFIEVRLPATFMEDHIWNRSLPGGVEVKSLKTVWVRRLTASDIREIYSDADFYSDAATAAEMGLRGLAASARATVKALRKALGVPEGAPFPSRAEIEAILAAMGG